MGWNCFCVSTVPRIGGQKTKTNKKRTADVSLFTRARSENVKVRTKSESAKADSAGIPGLLATIPSPFRHLYYERNRR